MKKRIFSGLMLLVLCLMLTVPTFAAEEHPDRLIDIAYLFTSSEYEALTEKLDRISEKLDFDVVIVTTDILEEMDPTDFADDFYDYNGYGMNGNDGILLLLSFSESGNRYAYSTSGKGIDIFDDSAMDDLDDAFLPALRDGEYYEACNAFADACEKIVRADGRIAWGWIVVAVLAGMLLSFLIPMSALKRQLKTVRAQAGAESYLREGSMVLTQNRDLFLYRNVARTAKQKNNSSTHTSSSGNSHGGRSGGF